MVREESAPAPKDGELSMLLADNVGFRMNITYINYIVAIPRSHTAMYATKFEILSSPLRSSDWVGVGQAVRSFEAFEPSCHSERQFAWRSTGGLPFFFLFAPFS